MSVYTALQDLVNTFIIDSRTTVEIKSPEKVIVHSNNNKNISILITVGSTLEHVKIYSEDEMQQVSEEKAIDVVQGILNHSESTSTDTTK